MKSAYIENGYIIFVATNGGDKEISDSEYETIREIISNIPTAPDGYSYMLRADTLEWELVELPPEPVDPEIDDAKALSILLGVSE